jgi:predicted PurR-regulated permease PerM
LPAGENETTTPPVRPDPADAQRLARQSHEPGWATAMLLIAVGIFLYLVRAILPPFVIAAVLAYVFSPVVGWIEARGRMRRALAGLIFLLAVLAPIVILIWAVEPTLVAETNELATDAPSIINNLLVDVFGSDTIRVLGQTLDARVVSAYFQRGVLDALGSPPGAIRAAAVVVELLLNGFLTLVLLVYFLLNPRPLGLMAMRLVPRERQEEWRKLALGVHTVLGRYVRGLAFLVVLMSVVTWLGLALVFHLPYAVPIAVTTGFLEIIPFLGPVTAGAIAAAVGLSHGGVQLALGIAVFYLVLRQMEDQLVMPLVIGRVVELHPAVAIFAVLAGTALWGVLGALLGIPVAAAVKVAFEHFRPE